MDLPPILLTHKRNSKSIVWQYFGVECNEDGNMKDRDMAMCNICLKQISAKGGNTSNLFQHMGVHHPQEYIKIKDKKLTCYSTPRSKVAPEGAIKLIGPPPSSVTKSRKRKAALSATSTPGPGMSKDSQATSYVNDSPRHRRMTEIVTYFLAKESVPVDMVETYGFKWLLRGFDLRYNVPNSQHFKDNMLPGFYTGLHTTIAQEVSQMSFFSATIDILLSSAYGHFLVFSVHFIDDEWVLKDRCLVTMFVPSGQSIQAIGDGLLSLLMPWILPPEKLTCVITKDSKDLFKVLEYMGWPQMPCFGTRLDQAIKAAIEGNTQANQALKDCRALVTSFIQNADKKRNLTKAKQGKGLSGYTLKLDTSGSWHATQLMISSLLKLEEAIRTALANYDEPLLNSFPLFKAVNDVLQPITEITELLVNENYVTLSSIKPLLHLLTTSVLTTSTDHQEVTNDVKRNISEKLVMEYQEYRCQVVLNLAAYLDPRFKSLFSNESEAESVTDMIISEGVENSTNNGEAKKAATDPEPSVKEETKEEPSKKRKSLGKLLEQLKSVSEVEKLPLESVIRKELDSYLTAPKLDSEANPLEWWKSQATNYPNLAVLARKYLSICATSAPSSFLFTDKKEYPLLQSMTDPEEVNTAVFLARNLHQTQLNKKEVKYK